jgi:DNA-binding SARP family transcriptional activator
VEVVAATIPSAAASVSEEPPVPVLVCVLGGFQVLARGLPVPIRACGKTEALLHLLALDPARLVPREVVLQRLWGESDADLATQSLNSLVYNLHRLLGAALEGASPILFAAGGYRLNHGAGVETDVRRFLVRAQAGDFEAAAGNDAAMARLYAEALSIYRGDLTGSDEVQSIIVRENLRARALTALSRLADYHYRRGDDSGCLEHALRLLQYDPCREDAHRQIMRCHLRRGERAQALRQFRICAAILQAEFEAAPEPATLELFNRIRDNLPV